MSNESKKLNKVLKQYYSHVEREPGESTTDYAARIIQNMQQYKMVTVPELFQFAKETVEYLYPKREIPPVQKELLNEFFQRCLDNEVKSIVRNN